MALRGIFQMEFSGLGLETAGDASDQHWGKPRIQNATGIGACRSAIVAPIYTQFLYIRYDQDESVLHRRHIGHGAHRSKVSSACRRHQGLVCSISPSISPSIHPSSLIIIITVITLFILF